MGMAVLDLWVIAPATEAELLPLAPHGGVIAADVLRQARGHAEATVRQRLGRALAYVAHRFPGRLRVHWVDPWSLAGLWFCWRHRIRHIPGILFPDGHQMAEAEVTPATLRDRVAAYLTGTSPDE